MKSWHPLQTAKFTGIPHESSENGKYKKKTGLFFDYNKIKIGPIVNNYSQLLKILSLYLGNLKKNDNYEISLIFTNNAYITLSTEIIEVTLDDQNKID